VVIEKEKIVMRVKKPFFYSLFLFSIVAGTTIILEFIILPSKTNLPRDAFLMGFAATPNRLVDDTRINSMGFTGDSIDLMKPHGTIRILTLGGSAMFNRRMTERLKNRLNTISTQPIEIVGAALRTHTTMSSVLKYKLLSKYHFDLVLFYHGINDLWANHVAIEDFKDDYSHLDPRYKRNFLLDHSLICRNIYNKWIYHKPAQVLQTTFRDDLPAEKVFKRNLITLIKAIRQNGSTPILMTFACSIPPNYTIESFKSKALGYNNPTNYDSCPVELWGPPGYVREGLQEHNRIVRQLAKDYDVLLIDQEKLMGKDLYWFGDVCHLSVKGTEKFIRNIAGFFIEQGLFQSYYQVK
jgi:hypothetical protein